MEIKLRYPNSILGILNTMFLQLVCILFLYTTGSVLSEHGVEKNLGLTIFGIVCVLYTLVGMFKIEDNKENEDI